MKKITKNMTLEMIEQYKLASGISARVEALKSRTFARLNTIIKAISAKDIAERDFWKMVTKKWPKTKGMDAHIQKNDTIVFSEYE